MSVTIKDIARAAGVSHITVSRALNGHSSVRPETREKIKILADKLNYIPNYNARSLVLDKSYIIGLFFSTFLKGTSAEYFKQAVLGVNSVIQEQYNMVIRGIDEYQEDYSKINARNFDGILVMSQREQDDIFVNHVLSKDIPIVVMNRESKAGVVSVLLNDRQGAYEVTQYLLKRGHEKIAIIEGREDFESSIVRKQGYELAMAEAGKPIMANYLVKGNYSFESGYAGMKNLMSCPDRPTAVFCFNDGMALGAIKAAFELGIKVPDNVSIIGFDGSFFSEYTTPALTTVKRPIEEMTQVGARKLLTLIGGESFENNVFHLDTSLIIRESAASISSRK